MITIKRNFNENYVTLCNVFLRDKKLSAKAKGVLATIMCLPRNWDFSTNGLVSIMKESRPTVLNIINELIEHGYCVRKQKRDEKGTFSEYEYIFGDYPQSKKPNPVKPSPVFFPQYNKELIKERNNNKERINIPNVIFIPKKGELSLPNAENANGELDEKQGTASMPEIAAQYQQAPPPTPSPAEAKQAAYARAEEEFRQELKQYTLEFGEDMINEFFLYWSEPNRSKTKMRKDIERTWDTHRRLLTWFRRHNENIMRHGTYIERKEAAKRQSDMESMQRLAAIAARGYSPKQENDEELGF